MREFFIGERPYSIKRIPLQGAKLARVEKHHSERFLINEWDSYITAKNIYKDLPLLRN